MPDTDTIVSSEAFSNKKGGKGSVTSDDGDISLKMLLKVIQPIVSIDPEYHASEIELSIHQKMQALVPKPNNQIPEDVCISPSTKIAPFCAKQTLSGQQAAFTFENTKDGAVTALNTALGVWKAALRAYRFAMAQAEVELEQAQAAAAAAYPQAINGEERFNKEGSTEFQYYFTMKLAIATALNAHAGSASAAADTLAGAAGALVAAAQTFNDTVTAAACEFHVDQTTADLAFWQSYET